MKKVLLLISVGLMTFNFSYSQALIDVGEKQLNFGFVSYGYGEFRSNGLYGGFDYCVYPDITIGGELGFQRYSLLGTSFTIFNPKVNADYHYNTLIGIPSEFDFYSGASLDLYFGDGVSGAGGFGLGIHVGGRWYWNEKWGLNLEFSGGARGGNGIKAGVSMLL